ncbi:MAG: hypothetical protein ABSD41_09100 [Candidatus Bathyarchaeia archaeon]|jgi:hypothetical protein
MRQKLLVVAVLLIIFPWVATGVHAQESSPPHIDITGGDSYIDSTGTGIIYAFPIRIGVPGIVWAIGVKWAGTILGSVRVALYTNNYTDVSERPSSLLTDSATVFVATSTGWQDIPVALRSVNDGYYWVSIQISAVESVFTTASLRSYYYRGFGSFDSSWPDSNYTLDNDDQWNMRVTLLAPLSVTQPLTTTNPDYYTHESQIYRNASNFWNSRILLVCVSSYLARSLLKNGSLDMLLFRKTIHVGARTQT